MNIYAHVYVETNLRMAGAHPHVHTLLYLHCQVFTQPNVNIMINKDIFIYEILETKHSCFGKITQK